MSYNEGRRSSLPSRPNKQQGDCQACSDVNNAAGNRPSMQQRGGSPNVQGTSPRNQRSWQQAKHATAGWNPKCIRDKPQKPTQLATGQACNNGVEPQMYKGQTQEQNNNKLTKMTQQVKKPAYNNWTTITAVTRPTAKPHCTVLNAC